MAMADIGDGIVQSFVRGEIQAVFPSDSNDERKLTISVAVNDTTRHCLTSQNRGTPVV